MLAKRQFDCFSKLKSATIATLYTDTELKMPKTGNIYYGRVRKLSRVNVIIGPDYESAVNKQIAREAMPDLPDETFKAMPRSWGERINGTPFIENKGTLYLETMVLRSLDHEYMIDSKPATPQQLEYIEKFLPKRDEGSRQPTEKKVIWRDYKLESIRAVKLGGKFIDFMAVVPVAPKKPIRKPLVLA